MQAVIDRRQFFRCSGCAALGFGLFAGVARQVAAAQDGTLPKMEAVQVAPNCWYVEGLSQLGSPTNQNFISNAGFVVTSKGVVVIDALGSPAAAKRLLGEIAKVTDQKVAHVIVSHYHADHIYGLQVFADLGVPITAHQGGREYLHSELAEQRLQASRVDIAPWIDADTRLIGASDWIDSRRELTVGDTQFILEPVGPAHTPEDLAVYVPRYKTLYAGDVVFRGRIPYVGGDANAGSWLKSLDKVLAMNAQVLVPGHGPISTDPRDDVKFIHDYLTLLRQQMGKAAEEMTPFEQAYAAADWGKFKDAPLFNAANRLNAYNTFLLMEREAK